MCEEKKNATRDSRTTPEFLQPHRRALQERPATSSRVPDYTATRRAFNSYNLVGRPQAVAKKAAPPVAAVHVRRDNAFCSATRSSAQSRVAQTWERTQVRVQHFDFSTRFPQTPHPKSIRRGGAGT